MNLPANAPQPDGRPETLPLCVVVEDGAPLFSTQIFRSGVNGRGSPYPRAGERKGEKGVRYVPRFLYFPHRSWAFYFFPATGR